MYKDKLKIVVKHFPLTNHKFARIAAQDSINDDKINEIAIELKLDMEKFQADINLPDIQRIINRDIQNGKDIGVAGTPTIFINGKQINPRTFDDFITKIESELEKKTNK
jgi:protein-disulfide isomerase